jgi:hypothetical protein
MHRATCERNLELMSPCRRRHVHACRRGVPTLVSVSFALHRSHAAVVAACCLPERENLREGNKRMNTSVEQAVSFPCHNVPPFLYIRISTIRTVGENKTPEEMEIGGKLHQSFLGLDLGHGVWSGLGAFRPMQRQDLLMAGVGTLHSAGQTCSFLSRTPARDSLKKRAVNIRTAPVK